MTKDETLRESKIGNIKVKVAVDVSDGMKALKALERQAKRTARALKEVESLSNK